MTNEIDRSGEQTFLAQDFAQRVRIEEMNLQRLDGVKNIGLGDGKSGVGKRPEKFASKETVIVAAERFKAPLFDELVPVFGVAKISGKPTQGLTPVNSAPVVKHGEQRGAVASRCQKQCAVRTKRAPQVRNRPGVVLNVLQDFSGKNKVKRFGRQVSCVFDDECGRVFVMTGGDAAFGNIAGGYLSTRFGQGFSVGSRAGAKVQNLFVVGAKRLADQTRNDRERGFVPSTRQAVKIGRVICV